MACPTATAQQAGFAPPACVCAARISTQTRRCFAGALQEAVTGHFPHMMHAQADNERAQSALFAARAQLEQEAAGKAADADESAAELQQARTQTR